MHSYFYPFHRTPDHEGWETALLCSFGFGVLLGCFLAVPFSDPGGRELALALLSSPRSAGVRVLWLILPLLAGFLLSLLRSKLPLLSLPLVLGIPMGYTVFFLLRFLGGGAFRGVLLVLAPSLAALPGLFWFLARRGREVPGTLVQDLVLASAMCLIPGLAAESALAPLLERLTDTISL